MLLKILTIFYPLLSLLGWVYVAQKLERRREIIAYEPRRLVPWAGPDLFLLFVLFVMLMAVASTFVHNATDNMPTPDDQSWVAVINMVGLLVFVAISMLYLAQRYRANGKDFGFQRKTLKSDLWIGVVAFFTLSTPVLVLQGFLTQWFPPKHPITDILKQTDSPLQWFILGLSAIVVVPIVEEFIFRGLLQGWLEKVHHRVRHPRREPNSEFDTDPDEIVDIHSKPSIAPIITTSFVFALLHLGQGPAPIPLFFLSCGLGYVYRQTHRLTPCIVIHALNNGTAFLFLYLSLAETAAKT